MAKYVKQDKKRKTWQKREIGKKRRTCQKNRNVIQI